MNRRCVLLVVLCLSLIDCGLFPESDFTLSDDSRLPKWFVLPEGLTRSDVTVRMYYYTGRKVQVEFLKKSGGTIGSASAPLRGLEPLSLHPTQMGQELVYPIYEVITINGVSELIEHRERNAIFYVNDDPNVWAALGLTRE